MTNDTNITNDKDINANIAHDDHFNDSIVNEVILEDMKKNRIDHMKYLPDMEVLDSDIMDRVVAEMDAYDYDKYTAADVRAALSHEYRTLEDFKALLSPAAQPFIEEIAQAAQLETRKHFGNSVCMFTPLYISNYCENYCIYCGFNCHNKINRAKLNASEIEKEMAAIAKTGLQEILILTGESKKMSDVEYIGEACKIARKYFKVIGLEVYPNHWTECGGHLSVNEQQQRQFAAAALRVEKVFSPRCVSERGETVTGWRRSAPRCRRSRRSPWRCRRRCPPDPGAS